MKKIRTTALAPGMITAEDVFNFNNQLILPRGLILTDRTITKLAFYSIFQIKIEDKTAPLEESTASGSDSPSYSERIRKSPEFIKFKQIFDTDVNHFKETLNEVIEKGIPLDINALMSQTLTLLNSSNKSQPIFDMLHNMRDYDDATYAHCVNVALICNVFAKWLHMDEYDIHTATISGLLHDIGKVKIPDNIVKKTSKLTNYEYNVIKTHPQEGYRLLYNTKLDEPILKAVLMHHERCDGTGYPFGFDNTRIGTFAKIVSIADVYDAMTSSRVYRGPLCPFTAIALFESEGLQKYDPRFIMTFLENIVTTYLLNSVRLSNGQEGTVVYINRNHLSAPTVKIGNTFLDLSVAKDITIEALI